jgi:hypothetical protein
MFAKSKKEEEEEEEEERLWERLLQKPLWC